MGKLFKTRLFGFQKKSVMSYIDSLAQNYSAELENKSAQLDKLTQENRTLQEQSAALQDKLTAMEGEREYIANAIIQAEQEAQKMMEAAKQEAATKRAELDRAMQEDMERAEQERKALVSLHQAALDIVRDYERKLAQLANSSAEKEEA